MLNSLRDAMAQAGWDIPSLAPVGRDPTWKAPDGHGVSCHPYGDGQPSRDDVFEPGARKRSPGADVPDDPRASSPSAGSSAHAGCDPDGPGYAGVPSSPEHREASDVNALILSISPAIRSELEDLSIDVDVRLAPDAIVAAVPAPALRRVILEIARNASHAMPHGGLLTIETLVSALPAAGEDADGLRYVAVGLSDSGPGARPEGADGPFDMFCAGAYSPWGPHPFATTVQRVVRDHHGFAQVTSTPDRGSAVWLHFPRREDARGAPDGTAVPG